MDNAERLMFLGWAKRSQFKAKVEQAKATIAEALAIAPAYVACSWGKDSTVLLHLAQQVQADIPVISFGHPDRDLLGYQTVIDSYCHRYSPSIETINIEGDHVPEKLNIAQIWERYPMAIVGVRKEESKARSISVTKYGLLHQFRSGNRTKSWRCFPIGYWGWKEVWAYIVTNDLPYLDAYNRQPWDRGRTTDHLSKTSNKRWQRTRAEEFARVAPDYYHQLKSQFPEMFW
jgi:3'-phosphoadenosine 5'-phosphosulfate sulfotransferase (PAPS reductase)/FAD synthetase